MKVLSLFDGCAMAYQALKNAGIKVDKYYSSEVDKYAISIAKKNHPDIVELGDVTKWKEWQIEKPDLIVGGSPCQGFSLAGKQLNFNDERSKLFFDFVDIVNHYKPKYFLLENVKMKKEYSDEISRILGVEPVFINSALVSAQNRQRLYWCNWSVDQPEDRGILLKDILQPFENIDESFYHSQKAIDYMNQGNEKWQQAGKCRSEKYTQTPETKKAFTLTANFYKGVPYNYFLDTDKRHTDETGKPIQDLTVNCREKSKTVRSGGRGSYDRHEWDSVGDKGTALFYRKLTPIECERLQTLPDNYTEGVSNTQRFKMLGNGFTVAVIEHLFKEMLKGSRKAQIIQKPHGNNTGGLKATSGKTPALTSSSWEHNNHLTHDSGLTYRKLTPIECERLQTLPDNYTEGVSNSQRFKMLGNGFTVAVIEHLFKEMLK